MSFLWCEWICSRCKEIHRARFEIVIGLKPTYQLKGRLFEKWGVQIDDVAFSVKEKLSKRGIRRRGKGSKIYAKWETQLDTIFAALREYMYEYYAIQENTLKMEICRP